ncbi:MAG: glutathione peroxidase [Phycisphaeraceae bacterium]|nr:glutathione peroxidase [Phycisphaeraceae bacterium]MBX3405902.1 glutathione peroxidase [Phycisphaeraceae bacterium]
MGNSRGGASDPPAGTQPAQAEKPAPQPAQPTPADTAKADKKPADVLSFKVKRIDGTEEDLSKYKGKVVVIVNVASKCGFTTQYEGLQALYAKHKDDGLVVLGFPANNFGNQEPGENKDIAAFCTGTFGVEFPMFEKVSVKGEDAHPLFKALAEQPKPIGGEPKWNFTKFVIDREGKVVSRFDAERANVRTKNLEDGLVKKVEELLAAMPKAEEKQ